MFLAAKHLEDVSPTSLYYDVNLAETKNVLDKMHVMEIEHLILPSFNE